MLARFLLAPKVAAPFKDCRKFAMQPYLRPVGVPGLNKGYQDTCTTKLIFFWMLFTIFEHGNKNAGVFFFLCFALGRALDVKKKTNKKKAE